MKNSKQITPEVTSLVAMQAITAIHEAIEQLSYIQLEQLDALEIAAIQNYYALVKRKLSEHDHKLAPSSTHHQPANSEVILEPDNSTKVVSEKNSKRSSKPATNRQSKPVSKRKKQANETDEDEDSYGQVKEMFNQI